MNDRAECAAFNCRDDADPTLGEWYDPVEGKQVHLCEEHMKCMREGKYCTYCYAPWDDQEGWIGCNVCDAWVHSDCEAAMGRDLQVMADADEHQYLCPHCLQVALNYNAQVVQGVAAAEKKVRAQEELLSQLEALVASGDTSEGAEERKAKLLAEVQASVESATLDMGALGLVRSVTGVTSSRDEEAQGTESGEGGSRREADVMVVE